MHYLIYRITNNIDDKIYIGKHQTQDLQDGYMGSGKLIQRAIAKHGIENFTKEILFQFDNEEEMNSKEKELVTKEFVKEDTNYNLCPGGQGGWGYVNSTDLRTKGHSKEMYIKVSKTLSEMKLEHRSSNMKKLHSEGKIRYDTFTNKTHTEETKRKIAESNSKMVGSKNSQFGTMWITNGKENKKISKDSIIPKDWYKGRTLQINKCGCGIGDVP